MQQQNGYVLLFVLFFLCCVLLCGSVLAFNLSDQLSAGNEAVQKEQSRYLAYSGWNLALEQLELYGQPSEIVRTVQSGMVTAVFSESNTAVSAWDIASTGDAGVYHKTASGTVQCFWLPFADTFAWPVAESAQQLSEAGILLVEEQIYELQSDCSVPLGVAGAYCLPITVSIQDEITVSALYVSGDLHVNEPLHAEAIYVTGEVYGAELISCDNVYSQWEEEMPYQIRVLQRQTA